MSSLPNGTVTFLFTDIEGSTKLWEKHPEAMKAVLAKHDAALRGAIESHKGQVIKTTGDGILAVFATALDAIKSTIDAQREFQTSDFSEKTEIPLPPHRRGLKSLESSITAVGWGWLMPSWGAGK